MKRLLLVAEIAFAVIGAAAMIAVGGGTSGIFVVGVAAAACVAAVTLRH